jgi:hypothetical protein
VRKLQLTARALLRHEIGFARSMRRIEASHSVEGGGPARGSTLATVWSGALRFRLTALMIGARRPRKSDTRNPLSTTSRA